MFWILIAVSILLAVLLVPVSLEISLRTDGGLKLEATPSWGGLTAGTWRSSNEKSPHSSDARSTGLPKDRTPRAGRRRHASFRKLRALFESDDFFASIIRWMRRIVRILAPREVRVHLRFGTGDPCETGHFCGVLPSVFALLPLPAPAEFDFEPDFVEQVFDLKAHARIRFAPLVLLLTSLSYFFTPSPWRAFRNYLRAR